MKPYTFYREVFLGLLFIHSFFFLFFFLNINVYVDVEG